MTDIIADMLTRIRNAGKNKSETVSIPYSKLKDAIAQILVKEGYIVAAKKEERNLIITLKYIGGKTAITGLKRISTPGLRVYAESKDLPKVLNGMGIAIISTSKGVMTDEEARKKNVGGEVLAYIW